MVLLLGLSNLNVNRQRQICQRETVAVKTVKMATRSRPSLQKVEVRGTEPKSENVGTKYANVCMCSVQGLSKRFERFNFGIFYLLIVKISYSFTHK